MVFDRIDKIKDYFRGIELTNGVRIVNVTYPPKWGVYPSDDETIKVAKSEDKVNEWFYYGDCELVTFSDMFDLIDNTIEVSGEYKNGKEKVNCKCKICGREWEAAPSNLLAGKGCPKCVASKGEKKVSEWLKNNNIFFL